MSLTVEDLAYGYPRKQVGRDVSFELAPGEIFCLLGPNGGGKTTLFKTILGLIPPQAGRVLIDGEDIAALPRAALARRIGYVPQVHTGYFPYTVHDIVLMGRTAHRGPFAAPGAADLAAVEFALEALGIAHLATHVYTRISGGERQLTLIARALAQAPKVLVMDEPTASLDFGNQIRVLEQIKRLATGGMTVIFSTHDPEQALLCGDRVAMLQQGRLAYLGAPSDVITSDSLREIYGVDVTVAEIDTASGTRRVCIPRFSPQEL